MHVLCFTRSASRSRAAALHLMLVAGVQAQQPPLQCSGCFLSMLACNPAPVSAGPSKCSSACACGHKCTFTYCNSSQQIC